MRNVTIGFGIAIASGLMCLHLAAQGQTPPPESKPTPPAIDGKWAMTIELESPDRVSTVTLKIDGTKVSGSVVGPSGEYPLKGEYGEGKLTFAIDYQGRYTVTFTGAPDGNDVLKGTLDYGQGPVNWKAERVKEKSFDTGAVASDAVV